MGGIIILLSAISLSAIIIAYIASKRLDSLERAFSKLDEYLHSKILADVTGKYNGVFTPDNKEIKKYQEWRKRNE